MANGESRVGMGGQLWRKKSAWPTRQMSKWVCSLSNSDVHSAANGVKCRFCRSTKEFCVVRQSVRWLNFLPIEACFTAIVTHNAHWPQTWHSAISLPHLPVPFEIETDRKWSSLLVQEENYILAGLPSNWQRLVFRNDCWDSLDPWISLLSMRYLLDTECKRFRMYSSLNILLHFIPGHHLRGAGQESRDVQSPPHPRDNVQVCTFYEYSRIQRGSKNEP